MTDFCEIHWTSGSLDEARKIARHLVQERLVACAQIVPWIESIYMWDNQMETTQESKIVFKAPISHFQKIKDFIISQCTYEVPEVLLFKIDDGNVEYLNWMVESSVE